VQIQRATLQANLCLREEKTIVKTDALQEESLAHGGVCKFSDGPTLMSLLALAKNGIKIGGI